MTGLFTRDLPSGTFTGRPLVTVEAPRCVTVDDPDAAAELVTSPLAGIAADRARCTGVDPACTTEEATPWWCAEITSPPMKWTSRNSIDGAKQANTIIASPENSCPLRPSPCRVSRPATARA